MLEFMDITVKFITNRGVSHELVRHRICSFAQESTRYCNYGGKDMQFITPVWLEDIICASFPQHTFINSLVAAERAYNELLRLGWTPQQAREVLPNALKTEIVMKTNLREWRHILKLRCAKSAHPQMRALMIPLLGHLKKIIPTAFDDIDPEDKPKDTSLALLKHVLDLYEHQSLFEVYQELEKIKGQVKEMEKIK